MRLRYLAMLKPAAEFSFSPFESFERLWIGIVKARRLKSSLLGQ